MYLIWADSDDRKLGRRARALIDRFWISGKVAVPAITFWEAGLLQARRRLRLRACEFATGFQDLAHGALRSGSEAAQSATWTAAPADGKS